MSVMYLKVTLVLVGVKFPWSQFGIWIGAERVAWSWATAKDALASADVIAVRYFMMIITHSNALSSYNPFCSSSLRTVSLRFSPFICCNTSNKKLAKRTKKFGL